MNSEYASNPHSVEPAVVDETPDGLRMDAELVRNLSDADEGWFSAGGRHGRGEDSQVPADDAWAEGTNWPGPWTQRASLRMARKTGEARAFALDLCAVVRPLWPQVQRRQKSCHQEDCENREIDQASSGHVFTSFGFLRSGRLAGRRRPGGRAGRRFCRRRAARRGRPGRPTRRRGGCLRRAGRKRSLRS
jgi:hypothetical protein